MIVEIVLILLILSLTARGWRQGLIETLGELVGAVIAFMVARAFSPWFAGILVPFMPGRDGLARFIAFVIIALIVARLVGFLFGLADSLLRIITHLPLVKLTQKIIGAILGFLSGIVLVGSATYLVLFYRLDPTLIRWLGGSSVASWCQAAFTTALRFLL
ncbi:CvpA family protein [Candidatus Uhrbacteria bacterium]|nr:MAG: CvpA family protein [Candidatus Uhrbacteria bacterium]